MATNNPPQVLSPSLPKAPDDIHLGLTRGDQYRGISQEMSEDQKDFKFPLRANSDNEERRAEEQSLWDAWANGIISRGLSIGTKLVEGGAILLSAPYAIATGSLNNLYDNAVVNAIASSDDWLRETFPVYGTKKRYEGQSFLSQLGTVKFWAEDAMNGVAFAISAYIGGSGAIAGLKGLAKGTKLTKVLKGTKAFKRLANMSSEAAVKNGIEVVASTAYNTITEAGFEANDVKKQLQEEYAINKYNKPFDELSNIQQNEISNEVAVYAKNVFVGNTLILAIPNLWQSNIFFGKNVGSGANKLFKSLQKGAISPKDLVKNKKVWKGVVKGATEGIVAEGIWEENIQTAMSNYEVRRMNRDLFNEKDTGDDRISGYANEWVKNFTTDEGLKSMFLGALIGAPMGAVSGGRKNAEANKDVTKAKLRYDSFINRLKNVDTRFEENVKSFYSVYEKDEEVDEVDEDGKPTGTKKNQRTKSYINPETGKPEVDLEKVLQLFYQTLNDKSLLDEAVTATMNNDPLHLEVVKQEAVARRVYSVLTDPDFDTIEEAVEYLKKQPDVDLSAFPGLDTEFKEQSEEVKKEIDYYAKILKEAQESLADIKDFQEDKEWGGFKRKLTKAHLLNMSALKALERKTNVVIEEVYAAREAIVAEHPDDYYKRKDYKDLDALRNLYYDLNMSKTFITNKAERERLFKEYKQEQNLLEELREKHETLKKKEDVNDDELLESEYSIEEAELLSGEFQRSNEKDEVLAQREKSNRILAVSEDERDRLAEFGMYNQFKYDSGKHIQTQQEFNKKWEEQEIPSDEDIEAAYELSTTAVDKNTLPEGEINPVELLSDEQKNTLSKYFPETNITDVSPEQAEELYNRLKAIKDEYDIDKIGLDNSKKENKIIDKVLRGDRTGDSNLLNFLKRKIANKVFDKVREILNAFENNPEYAESEYIAKVIKQLLRLRKIFSTEIRKELLESAEFEGFIEDIDSAIAMLTEKLKLAIENQNNKSAKQIESSKNESEYRFEALGINVEESTSEKIVDNKVFPGLLNFLMKIPTIKKIIIEAFSDTEHPKHKIYYERIVEIIKKDKVLSQKIKDFLEAHKHSLIEQAGEAYGDFISHAKLKEQYKQLAKYAASNPINTLVALIRFNTSERKDDAPQDNAIDNFIRSRDLNKLRKDLKEGKPTGYYVTTEQLSALVEVFYQLQMANDLQNDINSEYDHNEEYKNEDEILLEEIARIAKLNKENPGGRIFEIVPTFQQMFAIRDIIRWYKRKFNSGKYFTGWIYQKGIAGSGKTAIVYKWAIKILKLKENQIFSVAHTKEATDNINSVHSSSNSSGVLSKNLEASHISDDVKLLVIDEVGALDNQELAKIAIIVHEINKKRTDDNKLKVLALGDPNQINRSNFGIPVIDDWINIVTNTTTQENNNVLRELKNIESAFPLTVPYRSRVGILNTLADTFMDNFSKVSNLVLKANRAIGNRTVTGAHKGSVNEMVKQINAAKDNGRSKVIIVADINNVPKELKDTGLLIKDFVQVQGSTIDEAYIYIPRSAFAEMAEKNFNDAMYTAISRATEYVFLADTVGNMTWYEDSSVNESSAQFEKDMTDNFDNYTENLSYELGENPKNPPKDKPEDEPNNPPEDEPKDKPDNPPEEEPEDKSKNPPEDEPEETQEINPEKSINAEPTEEELDDYVVSDTFDDTGEDEDNAGKIHPTPTVISDHQITPKYPSYDAVKRKDKKDTEPRVQIGDTVYGVVVKDSRTGINRVLIIGAIGKNRYRILAELDEAEILDLVSKGELNYTAYANANPIKGAQFVRNSIVNIGTNFTSDTGENTPLLFKGKLGEGSMPLTYHYGSELSQGENVLTKALSKLVRLFKNNLFNAVDYAVIIPISAKALQKIFPSTTNNANNSLSLKEHVGEREITDELIEDLIANGQIVTDANGKVVYNNETYDTLEKLKQDIHKKEFEGNLYKGTPYIIMRAISNKGKEVFQYIRLNPAKVSKDSKYYFFRGEGANRKLHSKSLMQPIQEFRDALKEITNFFIADGGSFLGDMSFNRTLQEFKHFFSIDPNTKEIIKNKAFTYEMYKANIEKGNKSQYKHLLPTYDILSEELFNKIANSTAIDKVIKGYYGVSQRDKAHTHEEFVELYGNLEPSGSDNNVFIDTFEGKKYAFAPQKNNPSVGAIIEYEYSNGKETSKGEIEKEDFLKGGLGPAQSSLDLIAKANKSIKGKQLRVTKKLGDGRITTKAPNLLDDIMISNSYNAILNKMIKESEVEAKQDWFKTYLEKEQWMIENRIATIEQLQEIKERDNIKWTKIDDEMLDAIVEYDSEGNNNSLRLPLDANVINTLGKDMHTNKKALSDMLGTNLEGISPTKIVIDLDNNEREENLQKKEVPKKDSKEIKESIKDVPKESLEQDVNSFISKELTAEQQKALKKIDKNNNINFKC